MFGCVTNPDAIDPHATGPHAARNLALDEALARAAPAAPVLWCWRNPECVVVGRGQRIEREVDLAATARDGVAVLRRCSGGGTVFHDAGNLNVTLVLPGPAGAALGTLSRLLLDTLTRFGVHAAGTDRGLFAAGAKLAGFAALHASTATLVHASVLVSTPAERVMRYLTGTPATAHPLDSRRSPVGALNTHGVRADPREVAEVVRAVAAAEFGTPTPRGVTAAERRWQRRLLRTRYRHPEWHSTGREAEAREKEGAWTQKPVLISTG